jgi:hypothetical protein
MGCQESFGDFAKIIGCAKREGILNDAWNEKRRIQKMNTN